MKKVIKLTESDLRRIVRRVIAEQKRAGTDPVILEAIDNMNFKKEYCVNKGNEDVELSFEYCNKDYPHIMISYPSEGLELLDIKNQKIIKIWEGFTRDDIPELEGQVKNLSK